MAGLDGRKQDPPRRSLDEDLYHLPPEEDALVPTVCHSLDQALEALDVGRSFPHQGRRVHRQHARRLHRTENG
jgi:glutamine synthetase